MFSVATSFYQRSANYVSFFVFYLRKILYLAKYQGGAVNTACPICAVNMSECAGKVPEPKPEPEKESGSSGALVLILLAALGGGGVFAYIKFIKSKQGAKVSADPEDYEFEDEEYENE